MDLVGLERRHLSWQRGCLRWGLIRLLTSALRASLYRRIGDVLKPPDGWFKDLQSYLKPRVHESKSSLLIGRRPYILNISQFEKLFLMYEISLAPSSLSVDGFVLT